MLESEVSLLQEVMILVQKSVSLMVSSDFNAPMCQCRKDGGSGRLPGCFILVDVSGSQGPDFDRFYATRRFFFTLHSSGDANARGVRAVRTQSRHVCRSSLGGSCVPASDPVQSASELRSEVLLPSGLSDRSTGGESRGCGVWLGVGGPRVHLGRFRYSSDPSHDVEDSFLRDVAAAGSRPVAPPADRSGSFRELRAAGLWGGEFSAPLRLEGSASDPDRGSGCSSAWFGCFKDDLF